MTPAKKKTRSLDRIKSQAPKEPHRTPIEDISPEEQIVGAPLLGKVRSYDDKTREMSLILEVPLSVGDGMRVKGRSTDLIQRVERIRVGRDLVQSALSGETAAVSVADRVRPGDAAYKVRAA